MKQRAVELLEYGSLFLFVATPDDIEFERQRMEAHYGRQLAVYRVLFETRSGTRVTRVEWECVEC